jgi:hypothetical protein
MLARFPHTVHIEHRGYFVRHLAARLVGEYRLSLGNRPEKLPYSLSLGDIRFDVSVEPMVYWVLSIKTFGSLSSDLSSIVDNPRYETSWL